MVTAHGSPDPRRRRSLAETTHGNQVSLKPVYVLWRGGAIAPPDHPLFSSWCETRASWNGADGWVETCAWA